jgi:hypothetical protein
MKKILLIIVACALSAVAQQGVGSSCPVLVSHASAKVRLQDGYHIVIWFENQGKRTVQQAQLNLLMFDGLNNKYPASQNYVVNSEIAPGQGGVVLYSAQSEEKHFGSSWKDMRGVEVHVSSILFTDGTQWTSDPQANCAQAFVNANYEQDMRAWGKQWRANWNREHPDRHIPDPSLEGWLRPGSDSWQ